MRCSEARKRLTGSRRDDPALLEDRELKAHLAACPDCARVAESSQIMRRLLEVSAEDDTAAMLSQAERRRLVEARLADRIGLAERIGARLAALRYWWWRRPARGVSLGLATAVLAVIAFVPFSYNRTLGYDVAFANVCQEVAVDDDQICDMLHSLGLGEAAVDLEGCDTACDLNIIYLRSEEEVKLVVAALEKMCQTELSTSVIPLVDKTSGSLLDRANDKVFHGSHGG